VTPIVGSGLTTRTTWEVAAAQGPPPSGSLVVSVSVTLPLVILGVYVEVSELILEKEPVGALQVELVALPPILPASVKVPPAHIGCTGCIVAVAAWFTVIVLV
jgi:hypothetical protein